MFSKAMALISAVYFTLFAPLAYSQIPIPADTIASEDIGHAPRDLIAAIQKLWDANPAVRAAQAKLNATEARAQAASRPLYNPALELTAENADVDRRSVGISQTIDWSGKRRARVLVADAQMAAVRAERDQVRQQIGLEWLIGWVRTLAAVEQVALGQQRLTALQQFALLAERRFNAGDINTVERDLASLALQEALAQQAELLADQASAQQRLIAIGAQIDALPALPEGMPPLAAVSPALIDGLPDLRQARAEADVAQAKIGVAEKERKPDPLFTLSGGTVKAGPVTDHLVGLSVSIPLFVRNTYSAEAMAVRSESEQADSTYRDRLKRAEARVQQTTVSYNALRDAWGAWQHSRVSPLQERAALLQRLWDAGELSTADYLVQLKQTIDTELTARGLRVRLWQAWFDWLAASGAFAPWIGQANE